MRKLTIAVIALGLMLFGLLSISEAQRVVEEIEEESVDSEMADFRVVKVVEGLEHPWAVTWLDDGRMLITERPGRLLLVDNGEVTSLEGLPDIDTDEDQKTAPEGGNQGGLLDVVAHPDNGENGWIYFTYSSPGDDDSNFGDEDYGTGTALARAKINDDGTALEELEELYAQVPRTEPGRHYGSRILFLGDGTLMFSIGDRGIRYPSQDLTDPGGSIIRLHEDGGAVEENPFVGMEPGNFRPEIYSFGHRNNQGLAMSPDNGTIWAIDHGPYGGDLVYVVEEGKNYGWPMVAHGVEYSTKAKIGLGDSAPGVEEPKHVWDESMAPSGLAFYHNGNIEEWKGNLFAGSLLKEQLHRLEIENDEVVHDEVLITEVIGRIRDVRMGPDGNLYLLTDESDGGLYRIEANR